MSMPRWLMFSMVTLVSSTGDGVAPGTAISTPMPALPAPSSTSDCRPLLPPETRNAPLLLGCNVMPGLAPVMVTLVGTVMGHFSTGPGDGEGLGPGTLVCTTMVTAPVAFLPTTLTAWVMVPNAQPLPLPPLPSLSLPVDSLT